MRRSDEVDDSPRAHGFLNEGTAEDDCALFDTNRRFLKVFNDIQVSGSNPCVPAQTTDVNA
jgi:hypothetical protein